MLKDNKGITLASLVITIIVLLIIASISTISGMDTIDYIKFTNAKAQFKTMQFQVDSWYEEAKNNADVLNYGEEDLSTLDTQTISNTIYYGTGSTNIDGYRYFSADYIKNNFDIDGISYDFLINVEERTVLLFGGITYKDKTYYSAVDFELNKVVQEKIELEDKITFSTIVQDTSIVIYNVKFPNDMKISKYKVQYQSPNSSYWITLTVDKKGQYTDENAVVYNDAWYINDIIEGTYNVKITTINEEIKSDEVLVSNP